MRGRLLGQCALRFSLLIWLGASLRLVTAYRPAHSQDSLEAVSLSEIAGDQQSGANSSTHLSDARGTYGHSSWFLGGSFIETRESGQLQEAHSGSHSQLKKSDFEATVRTDLAVDQAQRLQSFLHSLAPNQTPAFDINEATVMLKGDKLTPAQAMASLGMTEGLEALLLWDQKKQREAVRVAKAAKASAKSEPTKLATTQLNLEASSHCGTALMCAVRHHQAETAKLLLQHGAFLFALGADGLTPLEVAASAGDSETLSALLDAGGSLMTELARFETQRLEKLASHIKGGNISTARSPPKFVELHSTEVVKSGLTPTDWRAFYETKVVCGASSALYKQKSTAAVNSARHSLRLLSESGWDSISRTFSKQVLALFVLLASGMSALRWLRSRTSAHSRREPALLSVAACVPGILDASKGAWHEEESKFAERLSYQDVRYRLQNCRWSFAVVFVSFLTENFGLTSRRPAFMFSWPAALCEVSAATARVRSADTPSPCRRMQSSFLRGLLLCMEVIAGASAFLAVLWWLAAATEQWPKLRVLLLTHLFAALVAASTRCMLNAVCMAPSPRRDGKSTPPSVLAAKLFGETTEGLSPTSGGCSRRAEVQEDVEHAASGHCGEVGGRLCPSFRLWGSESDTTRDWNKVVALPSFAMALGVVLWLSCGRLLLQGRIETFYGRSTALDIFMVYGTSYSSRRWFAVVAEIGFVVVVGEELCALVCLPVLVCLCLLRRRRLLAHAARGIEEAKCADEEEEEEEREEDPQQPSVVGTSTVQIKEAIRQIDDEVKSTETSLEPSSLQWLMLRGSLLIMYIVTMFFLLAETISWAWPCLADALQRYQNRGGHMPTSQGSLVSKDESVLLTLALANVGPLALGLLIAAQGNSAILHRRSALRSQAQTLLSTIVSNDEETCEVEYVTLTVQANEGMKKCMLTWPGGAPVGFCEPLLMMFLTMLNVIVSLRL